MTKRKARPPSIIVLDRPMVFHGSQEKQFCAVSPTTPFEDVEISLTPSGTREIQYIPITKTGGAEVFDQNAEDLLRRPFNHESCLHRTSQQLPRSMSATLDISPLRTHEGETANHSTSLAAASSSAPAKRISNAQACASEPISKKQTKWSSEEDGKIIELCGTGMEWEDISKQHPGRSAISCRFHYQNCLESRSE